MLYGFMNDGNMKWGKVVYGMKVEVVGKIGERREGEDEKGVWVMMDESEGGKRGGKSEVMGKVLCEIEEKRMVG